MVVWTLQAKEDLKAIHDYIARDSKFYAKIVTTGILNKSNYLSKYPFRGRKAPETNDPQIREVPVYSYRLIYWVTEKSIFILAVIHSRRNFATKSGD